MKFMLRYLFVFIVIGIMNKVYSQENPGLIKLSISEAQEYALQNNRTVKSAKIDVQSSDKKVWETLSSGLPQISLAANYQHQFVIPEISFGPYLDVNSLPATGFLSKNDLLDAYKQSPSIPLGVKDNTTFDFTLSQLIFSGQYLVGLQAVKVFNKATEKTLVKTEDQIKETVAGTYYLVLVLSESIRVLKESLKSVDQTFNDMVKMNQQGFNEETDVDQININRSNIKRLITSTESQKEISMNLLKYQLGMEFTQPILLTDSIPGIVDQANLKYLSAPTFKVENSIDYQLLNNQVELAVLSVKNQKSKYFPTVSAFYRRHEQTNQPSFNFAVKDLVGVSLNIPIFVSGQRTAQVSQAKFDLEKSQLNKENAGKGLVMEFESALSAYQTAFSNFTTNKESIVLSQKVYDKTLVKFHEGVVSSFELTQIQSQYLTAEAGYYTSILTLLNAKAKLDRILSNTN